MSDLAPLVIAAAKARGIMIATAESCTGGMIAAALTDTAGSSAVFERGFVTYSNAAKTEMLGVPAETIAHYGAVSEEVASAMATGALERSRAGLTVSVTGIAGPGGSEHKPEGRVCFGLACTWAPPRTWTCEFGAAGRGLVRHHTREHAFDLILSSIK